MNKYARVYAASCCSRYTYFLVQTLKEIQTQYLGTFACMHLCIYTYIHTRIYIYVYIYSADDITAFSIQRAHARITPHIHRTPLMTSQSINALCGCTVFFKCEVGTCMYTTFKHLQNIVALSGCHMHGAYLCTRIGKHVRI